jgi:hypothetical protein
VRRYDIRMIAGGHPRTLVGSRWSRGFQRASVQILTIALLTDVAYAQSQAIPAGFEGIDTSFRAFLQTYSFPGASIAIAKDGRWF